MIRINYKKLTPLAKAPTYGTEYSAGADLYAALEAPVVIAPQETALIHTGIAMQIPTGKVGLVHARSGLATKQGLAPANKVGVIDSDYRGEIMVALHNHGTLPRTVNNGDRIAQLLIMDHYTAEFEECEQLDDSQRGEGGFGSTGK